MLHCYPLMREQHPTMSAYNTNKYVKSMQPTPTQRRRSRRGKKKCKPEARKEAGSRKPEARKEVTTWTPDTRKEVTYWKLDTRKAGAADEKKKSVSVRRLLTLPAKKKNQVIRKHTQKFFFFGTQRVLFHNGNGIKKNQVIKKHT